MHPLCHECCSTESGSHLSFDCGLYRLRGLMSLSLPQIVTTGDAAGHQLGEGGLLSFRHFFSRYHGNRRRPLSCD